MPPSSFVGLFLRLCAALHATMYEYINDDASVLSRAFVFILSILEFQPSSLGYDIIYEIS